MHKKDKPLLQKIKSSLGVGKISKRGSLGISLQVQSIKEIKVILEHFDKYPLLTKKQADYQALKLAYFIIKNKEHLTKDGLRQIVAIKATMSAPKG